MRNTMENPSDMIDQAEYEAALALEKAWEEDFIARGMEALAKTPKGQKCLDFLANQSAMDAVRDDFLANSAPTCLEDCDGIYRYNY